MRAGLVVALSSALRRIGHCFGRDIGYVLILTAVVLLFFWPVLLAGYVFPKGGGDLWGQLYPVWAFVARQVTGGVLPLWDPLLMAGDPILSEAQYGLFNPLNWPLFVLAPPSLEITLARGMVNLLLAGVGMYLFLTRSPGLRLSRLAGVLGGMAYMLADPFVVHLGHPQINDAMAWLPWGLLGIDWALAAAKGRRAALAGIPVTLMLLAGHGQIALYGLITLGLYGLMRSAEAAGSNRSAYGPNRPGWMNMLSRLLLMALVGFLLSAPTLLPAIERMPWTNRALVPADQRRGYEFFPAQLVDSLAPNFHGRGAAGWWPQKDRVESGYAGAVMLLLACLGLVTQRRRALFWVGLAGVAFLFALGYQGPLYPLVARWPFFDDLWKTARAIFVLAFCLAVLGALGLDSLLRMRKSGWVRAWCGCLALGAVGLAIAAPYLVQEIPAGAPQQRALENLRLVALLTVAVAFLAWTWVRWRSSVSLVGIVLLLTTELVALGALVEVDPSAALPTVASAMDDRAGLAFLRSDPGWFRVDSQGEARHLWSPEVLQVQGFETLQGSGNPLGLWPFEQFYWTQPNKSAPGYRLLGAKYIIMPKGDPPAGAGIWPVFIDDPFVDIHLNTGALPRAWLVYKTEVVENYEEAWRRIQTPDFVPEQIAVVEGGPRLDGEGRGEIQVVRYRPNDVQFIVDTDAPALLVLTDTFYPGWQGHLDGDSVAIYRADVTFRGILVPPGSHAVRWRFSPRSFRLGLGMAGTAGLVLVMAALPTRAKRQRFRFSESGTG